MVEGGLLVYSLNTPGLKCTDHHPAKSDIALKECGQIQGRVKQKKKTFFY